MTLSINRLKWTLTLTRAGLHDVVYSVKCPLTTTWGLRPIYQLGHPKTIYFHHLERNKKDPSIPSLFYLLLKTKSLFVFTLRTADSFQYCGTQLIESIHMMQEVRRTCTDECFCSCVRECLNLSPLQTCLAVWPYLDATETSYTGRNVGLQSTGISHSRCVKPCSQCFANARLAPWLQPNFFIDYYS